MRDGLNSSPLVGTRTTVRIVGRSIVMRTILLRTRTGTNAGGELMASCFVTQPEILYLYNMEFRTVPKVAQSN